MAAIWVKPSSRTYDACGRLTLDDIRAVKPVSEAAAGRPLSRPQHQYAARPVGAFQFLLTLRILRRLRLFQLRAQRRRAFGHALAGDPAGGTRAYCRQKSCTRSARPDLVGAETPRGCGCASKMAQPLLDRPSNGLPAPAGGEHHTTSFSIGDREGNPVCITQSLGSPFGSGVVVPGTGLALTTSCIGPTSIPLSSTGTCRKRRRRAAWRR